MARGSLAYISMHDGFSKRIDKVGVDSYALLLDLMKDFKRLLLCDIACGHGAEINIFDNNQSIFHYKFNNWAWRDENEVFSRG